MLCADELGKEAVTETSRRPTARDVARLAGVSQATVSYVLNGRRDRGARISEETRRRILAATAELGYMPNQAARSLRYRRTERVAVIVKAVGLPYFDALVHTVQRAADEQGYTVIVMVADSPERELTILSQLGRGLVDGAVFMGTNYDRAALDPLAKIGLALVVVGKDIDGAGIDIVRINSASACAEALCYLIDRGHRRIAYLGPEGERMGIYREVLAAHGLALDEQLIRAHSVSWEHSHRDTSALLRLARRPSAIFATAQIAAAGAIWTIRDAGLSVPGDVAVIGVGSVPGGVFVRPALTAVAPVSHDYHEAAELLFSRLRGEAQGESRVREIEYRLILRDSA